MHFEILVEDSSGKRALDILVPMIIGERNTFKVHSYKGIGRLPKNLRGSSDPQKRILLDQLPRLLRGYFETFTKYSAETPAYLFIVCDLDGRCQKEFRQELIAVSEACMTTHIAKFCIAVEELEAWFLGDPEAIRAAYPKIDEVALSSYQADSICGTWEVLANVLYPGGAAKLTKQQFHIVGAQKHEWAEKITPHLDIDNHPSPSFGYFRDKLKSLA